MLMTLAPPQRAGGRTGAEGLARAAAWGQSPVLLRGGSEGGEGLGMGVVPVDGGGAVGTKAVKAAAAGARR